MKLNRRLVFRIVVIACSILFCLGVAFLVTFFVGARAIGDFFEDGCPASEPANIEAMAHFKLPPSAHNLDSSCWGMQGWYAHARFEMAPGDLDELVASTLIETPLSANVEMGEVVSLKVVYPEMDEITSYLYGKHEACGSNICDFLQEIVIDTGDETRYVVYIQVLAG